MFAISADFNSRTHCYGYKGALFSSFLKLLSNMPMTMYYDKISNCPKHTTGSPNNLQTSFSQTSLQLTVRLSVQRVISYSPGLVDFAIGQVNSVLNLLDGLVKFFWGNSNSRRTVINPACQEFFGGLLQ